MARPIRETVTGYENNISSLTTQRARQMKKIIDSESDIKRGMGGGSILLLDWARDVKYFLESNKDLLVTDDNIVESYKKYVEELISYINESQRSDTASVEQQRLIDELGRQVRKLNKQISEKDEELRKGTVKPTPNRFEPQRSLPREEEEALDEVYEEDVPLDDSEPVNDSEADSEPTNNGTEDEGSEPVEEVSEKTESEPQAEAREADKSIVYITDAQLSHLKEVNTKQFEIMKAEAYKMRHAHEMFTDYSTVEHRYYKTVLGLLRMKEHPFDAVQDNLCRVCKKPIPKHKSVCSPECKNIQRRFKAWFNRYGGDLKGIDMDLKPISIRKVAVEKLAKARKKYQAERPPLDNFEKASSTTK